MNTLTRTVFPTQLALLSLAAAIIGPHAVVHAADQSHVRDVAKNAAVRTHFPGVMLCLCRAIHVEGLRNTRRGCHWVCH